MKTFGNILDENKGVGPGFDALRIALAVGVLSFHSTAIVGTGSPQDGPARYVSAAIVPTFFALSGFLVIASALRVQSLATFLTFRGLRIAPALFAEVLITGLLIGPVVSSLSARAYYTDPLFFTYFANLVGNIQMHLPGVFSNNPSDVVNLSLWTVRPEIICYLVLAMLMLSGLYRRASVFVILAVLLFVLLGWGNTILAGDKPNAAAFNSMTVNIMYFLVGGAFYHLRHRIPYSWGLFFFAALVSLAVLQIDDWRRSLSAPALVYCTCFLGLTKIPLQTSREDYSYGIYLFAFPIQQLVASFPSTRIWWLNIALALPITFAVAYFSWHIIEKPVLRLREQLKVSQTRERALLLSMPIRFVTAWVLLLYGSAVAAWGGLFKVFGTRLHDQLIGTIVATAIVALLATFAGNRAEQQSTIAAAE